MASIREYNVPEDKVPLSRLVEVNTEAVIEISRVVKEGVPFSPVDPKAIAPIVPGGSIFNCGMLDSESV